MICIVFIFIAIVTVIVIFSMFMFIIVTIIKLLLGFFQDLNRRQSHPNHLRTLQTPKTWHPRLRTAPLTPHSISAGGTGRGGCSFGDVGPGAAGGREEPHTEFSPGHASQGVARAKFGETPCFSGKSFCIFFFGVSLMGIFLEVFDEQDTSMRLARTSQTTILQSDVCISDEILGHLIGSRM